MGRRAPPSSRSSGLTVTGRACGYNRPHGSPLPAWGPHEDSSRSQGRPESGLRWLLTDVVVQATQPSPPEREARVPELRPSHSSVQGIDNSYSSGTQCSRAVLGGQGMKTPYLQAQAYR